MFLGGTFLTGWGSWGCTGLGFLLAMVGWLYWGGSGDEADGAIGVWNVLCPDVEQTEIPPVCGFKPTVNPNQGAIRYGREPSRSRGPNPDMDSLDLNLTPPDVPVQ